MKTDLKFSFDPKSRGVFPNIFGKSNELKIENRAEFETEHSNVRSIQIDPM